MKSMYDALVEKKLKSDRDEDCLSKFMPLAEEYGFKVIKRMQPEWKITDKLGYVDYVLICSEMINRLSDYKTDQKALVDELAYWAGAPDSYGILRETEYIALSR